MKVVLKKFRGPRAETFLSNELKALGKEKHPNVVEVLDFYRQPYPCLVTRFIDGPTLSDYIKRFGPLPEATAIEVLRGIGKGLEHLHKDHVVHRDLKPENIILEGVELKAVLIDLGLGKTAETTSMMQGATDHCQGTYHWMAPEMMDPNKDDGKFHWSKKTDIYALGIIMWQLFTGEMPYAEIKMPQKLIKGVVDGNRPSLENVKVSSHLVGLMQKCWDADDKQRPSIQEFLNQLSMEGNGGLAHQRVDFHVTSGNAVLNAIGLTVQENSVDTFTAEFSEHLTTNSNATIQDVSSSLESADPLAIGKSPEGVVTKNKNTEEETRLDEVTVTYETDDKIIQVILCI
jgi:serine/threonine protein kinase